jgi:hypothetical protein
MAEEWDSKPWLADNIARCPHTNPHNIRVWWRIEHGAIKKPIKPANKKRAQLDRAIEILSPMIERGDTVDYHLMRDLHAISLGTLYAARQAVEARIAATTAAIASAAVQPPSQAPQEATYPDASHLPPSQQETLSKLRERHAAILEREREKIWKTFEFAVDQKAREHSDQWISSYFLPKHAAQVKRAEDICEMWRNKPFTEAEFKLLLRALHPDMANHPQLEKFRHDAMVLLNAKAPVLRPDRPEPVLRASTLPKTREDLMAHAEAGRKAKAARRANGHAASP